MTAEISQHLTPYGGARERPMEDTGQDLGYHFISHLRSTPRLRSDTRWEPEIILAVKCAELRTMVACKTRSDTCINTAEREKS